MKRWSTLVLVSLCFGYCLAQQAVDFTATDVKTGADVSLSQYSSSRGVVIIFTSNECPFDKEYRERITTLVQQSSKALPVVLINSHPGAEEAVEKMKEMMDRWNADVRYLADKSQSAMTALDAKRSPQAFLLKNSGGKFNVIYSGAIDDSPQSVTTVTVSYLQDAIQRFLNGRPIETTQTRAVGCTIRKN